MLTKSQIVVYLAIKDFIKKRGYSPSIRELCEITGRRSPATIQNHLINLKQLGYVEFIYGKNRTLRIKKDL